MRYILAVALTIFIPTISAAQTGRPLTPADIKERCSDGCAGWCQKRAASGKTPNLSGCMTKCQKNSCGRNAYR